MDELRKFIAPEFIIGPNALYSTGAYARQFGAERVLVVTDPGVFEAGWPQKVEASIRDRGVDTVMFKDVSANPRDHEVMAGAERFRETGCDLIVAVGGGSAIDCAKGIGIVSSGQRHILEFQGVDQIEIPGPPLICVPTTAGSSADISQFAIICDSKQQIKVTIISKTLVPDLSLIDPVTTTTLSRELTAETGMDALSHAFEAYVSNASSPITDINALKAVSLITENLKLAFDNPLDLTFRSNMMLASLFAGLAFSNASLGLVHAMAHSLGGRFDLPHGQTNALLLESVVNFNFNHARERYRNLATAMGLGPFQDRAQIKQALGQALGNLRTALGITGTPCRLDVTNDTLARLTEFTVKDPCIVTNPIMPTRKEIQEIYAGKF
jgi:alcohol dehydrogenase class IV